MTILLAIGTFLAAVGGFEVLVWKFGAESRPGFDEATPLV